MTDFNKISTWYGKPITELTREELLEVIDWCGKEILHLQKERDRWRDAGDPLVYMMNK